MKRSREFDLPTWVYVLLFVAVSLMWAKELMS